MRVRAECYRDGLGPYPVEADCIFSRDAQELHITGHVVLDEDVDWLDLTPYEKSCAEDRLAEAWEDAMDAELTDSSRLEKSVSAVSGRL